eukprot:TRINITY_DN10096_c0_g1_i1.p1 TRINITY_DN10096_c0_g1~~TRINITY_DN10096_c0_g1_i1.p1  ORF type:complete len:694 (+),score=171.88 TRINITY_DN10096_c0_g1_i1:89-2170(+)
MFDLALREAMGERGSASRPAPQRQPPPRWVTPPPPRDLRAPADSGGRYGGRQWDRGWEQRPTACDSYRWMSEPAPYYGQRPPPWGRAYSPAGRPPAWDEQAGRGSTTRRLAVCGACLIVLTALAFLARVLWPQAFPVPPLGPPAGTDGFEWPARLPARPGRHADALSVPALLHRAGYPEVLPLLRAAGLDSPERLAAASARDARDAGLSRAAWAAISGELYREPAPAPPRTRWRPAQSESYAALLTPNPTPQPPSPPPPPPPPSPSPPPPAANPPPLPEAVPSPPPPPPPLQRVNSRPQKGIPLVRPHVATLPTTVLRGGRRLGETARAAGARVPPSRGLDLAALSGRRPPPPPEQEAPPAHQTISQVLTFVDVPHTGSGSIECTLGTARRRVDRGAEYTGVDSDRMTFVSRATWPEVADLRQRVGRDTLRQLSPRSPVVHVALFRDPVSRAAEAFQAALGQQLGSVGPRGFRCEGAMQRKMMDPGFSIEQYVALPAKTRALCEAPRNAQVKALVGKPPGSKATSTDLEGAKNIIRRQLDVVMLEEDVEKSMHFLTKAVNGSVQKYFICKSPYPTFDTPTEEVIQVLRKENALDVELMELARHHFFTKWAGRHEESFQPPKCEQQPRMCWNSVDDPSQKRKPTVRFADVGDLAKPICATGCDVVAVEVTGHGLTTPAPTPPGPSAAPSANLGV